ncbi:B-4DMT family transporter [Mycobacterium sp.]|uniref:B-4DMT family transporter n=1 Tax=Mycobacterium sp. TaxID=1785 RepID=UPI003D6B867F
MTNWMLRGLAFAGAMVVVRLLQGTLINALQTQAAVISIVLVILFLAGVVVWGVLDGRADATANPDPDRRDDLAMIWLLGGVMAGLLSGVVTWLIALVYKGLYVGGLINEITTFAAFTALLVFLGGVGGAALGRWLIDRNPPAVARHGGDGEDRVDTDVFAAVRTGDTATDEAATAQRAEATAVPPAYSEETTEAIPTEADSEQTKRAPKSGDDQG